MYRIQTKNPWIISTGRYFGSGPLVEIKMTCYTERAEINQSVFTETIP